MLSLSSDGRFVHRTTSLFLLLFVSFCKDDVWAQHHQSSSFSSSLLLRTTTKGGGDPPSGDSASTTTTTFEEQDNHDMMTIMTTSEQGKPKDLGPPVVDLSAPPMGFMSWERFRCQIDCNEFPDECVNDKLYMKMADALVADGYASHGYKRVHIDDCWTIKSSSSFSSSTSTTTATGRNVTTRELVADPIRFPKGIQALANYMHNQGLELGIYTDVGSKTCAGYEGSLGHEEIDAKTFAKWGVDYVKVDGCNLNLKDMEAAYTAFGRAIKKASSIKKMIYSCSWPAYITANNEGDESQVPFDKMYNQVGCNTWRNWNDIDNTWESVKSIIYHWADNWKALRSIPQGSFNDADMLIVGDDHYGEILPIEQAKLQFGFWAMISSPLLIGGDVRKIPATYRDILLNGYVLSVNQDLTRSQPTCVVGCKEDEEDDSSHHSDDTPHISNSNKEEANDSLQGRMSSSTLLRRTTPSSSDSRSAASFSENVQIWTKQLEGYSIKNAAIGFFNLGDSPVEQVVYYFPLESSPMLALCSDLWSKDPSQTVCPKISTSATTTTTADLEDKEVENNNEGKEDKEQKEQLLSNHHGDDDDNEWNIQVVKRHKDDDDNNDAYYLEITALNLPPTSHRLLRVYLRYASSSDENNNTSEQEEGEEGGGKDGRNANNDIDSFRDEVRKLSYVVI